MTKKFISKLPSVHQTDVQKQFYSATFDQVFNSANVQAAHGYIGRRSSDVLNPMIDNYLEEPTKERAAYSLEPIAYAVNAALNDSNHLFYEDLINYIKANGGNVNNHDRLFADNFYSFAPPVDVDKFLNYSNYLWLYSDGSDPTNTAPIAYLNKLNSLSAEDYDALIEGAYDDGSGVIPGIIGNTTYNTSQANGYITNRNFDLSSGMRVQFVGSLSYDEPLYVTGVGRGIRLVKESSVFGFNEVVYDDSPIPEPVDLSSPDYITIERGSIEGSPWSRTNRWFHEDAVDAITQLGQLQSGTIENGGVGYNIGDVLLINIGDGTRGSFVVTSTALGGVIDGIDVLSRGEGYSFAKVNETGVPSPVTQLAWDNDDPFGPGSAWDPNNIESNPSGYLTKPNQTEADYDNVSPNGTYNGGSGFIPSPGADDNETITLSDGTILRIDNVDSGGDVNEFTVLTGSTSLIINLSTLTQSSTTASGTGFTLTLDTNNVQGVSLWDDNTITNGAGSGAIINGNLATAVSRSNKAQRPILEFHRDIELYDFGTTYIGDVNVAVATENFGAIHGQAEGLTVDGVELTNGMTLIFLNPDSIPSFIDWDEDPDGGVGSGTRWDEGPWEVDGLSGAVTRFVWEVSIGGGSISLTQKNLLTSESSPTVSTVAPNSVVTITSGNTWAGYSFYQYENTTTDEFYWRAGQQKLQVNKPPLFNLYDTFGILLNDTLEYPSSDFSGSELFSYKILTQQRLNELGDGVLTNDDVLGFPIETKGFRQLGDILFENDIESTQYTYTSTESVNDSIDGYYFFKQFVVNESTLTIENENYETNWKSSTLPEEQKVVDRYLTASDTEDEFAVSVVPATGTFQDARCLVVASGRRLNTSEFAYISSTQTVRLFARPTEYFGIVANGIAQSYTFDIQDNIQITLDGVYLEKNVDYTITNEVAGNIEVEFVNIPPQGTFLQGTNRVSGAPGKNKVVEILSCTNDTLTSDARGFFEIPNALENNPNNLEITEQSWNELTPHFTSIITEQSVYEGAAFGAGNNFRDTAKDGSLGSFIIQNQSPLLKTMFCASSNDLDIIEAIRFNSNEYTRFKNRYIKIAQQLINEGFTDFNASNPIVVSEWVDEILQRITRGREYSDAFEHTYMIAWNNVYEEEVFTASSSSLFTTSNFVDLNDSRNAMYVYVNSVIALVDRDYTITNINPIQITFNEGYVPESGAEVVIRLYENSSPAHIPSTPTKLGLYKAVRPEIVTDDTYIDSVNVIVGHDGSRTPAYGSELDDLLLELESRIYNGILSKFRLSTDSGDTGAYNFPLVEHTHKPGKFRTTRWSLREWNDLIKQSFFKWSAANKADYVTNNYYDNADLYTWNYKTVSDVDDEVLPAGYWRGIFDYYYDTQTPHETPWEMLGFFEKPIWWESCTPRADGFSGYGAGPWPNTDAMWQDIEEGRIRRKYDSVNGEVDLNDSTFDYWVVGDIDERYARPNLVSSYLPVDAAGALKASPIDAIDVSTSLSVPSTTDAQADYTWGDWAPIEYAWRTSESYPFALMEALFLARPGEFGEKYWDPEHIFEVPVDSEQIVNDDNDLRKRVSNDTLYVHGETVNDIVQINTGYQVWISSRLRSLKKDLTTDFGALLRTLDVKLGHKMAGFTDKDTLRVFVEGISVSSLSTNLLIPSENINVSVYTGTPVGNYFYSGVLIRSLENNEYQIFGYDILKGEFTYYERDDIRGVSSVNVGGQPESFTTYQNNKEYNIGDIIKLNGIFYRAKESHTSDSFDPAKWVKLQNLPITGGLTSTYKPNTTGELLTLKYGDKLSSTQEVYDFLIGWGDYLSEEGWQFDDIGIAGTINDWNKVAKDFLLWAGSSWEEGAIIMLSPSGEKVVLEALEGYPGNVERISSNAYSILDKQGVAIDPRTTAINREDRRIEVSPTLDQVGVFGLRVQTFETESIVTFDNTTVFNDVIYDPVLGSRLARLDFRGRRTLDWTGKLEAGGFIITADGLLPNYENIVDSIRHYHNTEVQLDQAGVESVSRHLIGFDERDYFTDLGVLDDAQFQFYQGLIRQKGTKQAIEKLERNELVTNIDDELNVIEEWALRVGEFGGVCRNQYTEFLISANEVKDDPQLVQLSYPASKDAPNPRTFAFDDVDTTENTITIKSHRYRTGSAKKYTQGSGTVSPTGLVSDTVYYVIVVDENTIQFASTLVNAMAVTPVAIDITAQGSGTANTLTEFPSGRVTAIDIISASNVYTIPPTIFITNHPDDSIGSGATASSVLDDEGKLLRIDILNPGTGYSLPPRVAIGLPTISADSDRATARIRFDVTIDVASDEVILIDIDDESRWITKPTGTACDVAAELWPEATEERYRIPNAGYVHKDDITFEAFDVDAIDEIINNTTVAFEHGQFIWVARDPSEEFGVYFLDNYKVSTIDAQDETDFDGTEPNGSFVGGTGYSSSERIIMSDGTEIIVDTVDGSGTVVTFDIDETSSSAVAGRGSTSLTAVSSNVSGNNDFVLTLGIANEETGSALPGTAATITQTGVGTATLSSLPREDVIKAQFEIDVDGTPAGEVTSVTVIDGGFGYTQGGTFTVSNLTHGAERNSNETDAVITYTVASGVVNGASVTVDGTSYGRNVESVSINAPGSGYNIDDVLTVTGGTLVTGATAAKFNVTALSTIAAQDETDFDATPVSEGTFIAGKGHASSDVITLSDGTTVTVDDATISLIIAQDETNFDGVGNNGTFSAGNDYFVGDVLTMTDGSVIQVEACSSNGDPTNPAGGGGPVSDFRIVSPTTKSTILVGDTIGVSIEPGNGGLGFTITVGSNNAVTTSDTGIVTEFSITTASTAGIVESNSTLTQTSTAGNGTGFGLVLNKDNQGIHTVDISNAGSYSVDPTTTGAATTVSPVGGTGATIDLTIKGDNIVVDPSDVPAPIGWGRYLGNTVPDSGKLLVNGSLYEYARTSGFDFAITKNGVAIEDNTIDDDSPFFTLMNVRYRDITSERNLFDSTMTLAGVNRVWTDDNGSGLWEVSALPYASLRTEENLIETFKFRNAYVYDADTKDTLAQISVYDPYKGILPGSASQNIHYIRQRDPARYTNASSSSLIDTDLAFDKDQLGQLWWDTSTCAYVLYEQGTDAYRRDNWGHLFSGSSIDIYEWSRSTDVPANYMGDGTVRNETDYVVSNEWDSILEEVRTFYYFWIKNRTVIPEGINRTVAGFEVANIINNPLANLYQWFSPISQTGFMFAGVDNVFTDSNNIFQINYRHEDERPTHVEWELGREYDVSYTPNDIHWNKMVDSLVGYTNEIDISAAVYTDAIATFNTDATGIDATLNIITTVDDHGFTNGAGVVYSNDGGVVNVGLTNGQMYYVEVISTDEFALHPTSQLADPVPPATVNSASRISINIDGTEVHTVRQRMPGVLNNFSNALPTADDETKGYLIVPDPSLSESQQLGILTRPMQSMFLNIQAARRIWRDKINLLVKNIILRDVNPNWNESLTTNNLWEWTDWYADGYDAFNTVPVRQVDDTSDLSSLSNLLDGEMVKVIGTRYSIYAYNADTNLYDIVAREKSRLHISETVYTSTPTLEIALELREIINALRTEIFINDIAVYNNLVFFAMLNYVFSEQEDLDWAFKTTYVFLDQTGNTLQQDRVFQSDPFDAALSYITEAKPYQTKIRDFRITRKTEVDDVLGTITEPLRLMTPKLVFDQIRGGNLSVTEMRIAKYEMLQSASYNGHSTLIDIDGTTIDIRLGAAGRAVNSYREYLDALEAPTGGTQATFTVDISASQLALVTITNAGAGYANGTGYVFNLLTTAGGGDGLAEITYDVVGGSITNAMVSALGSGYANGTGQIVTDAPLPLTGTTLSEFDPKMSGAAVTNAELESVSAINEAITADFFYDFQGLYLTNTSFGGLPMLESFELVPSGGPAGTGYVVGEILSLDAGSGIAKSNALFYVSTIDGSGGITSLFLVSGGSYTQTPTVDPVNLNGGSGTGAQVTSLEFINSSAVPYDTVPWDQIGFESSAHDPSVTSLTGSPDNLATTIPGQSTSNYDGTGNNGSFDPGAGYVAGAAANDYTSGLTFADANPDTITRTDGTSFLADGFAAGQELRIENADVPANIGTYTINTVTATTITLNANNILVSDGPDTNATISRFDNIVLSDETEIRVDSVGGSGEVTAFTITSGSASYLPPLSTLTQLSASGAGDGFSLMLGEANETSGTFADVPAEESFSGNGNQKEFTITTDTPTIFMFVVVDDIEQVLNVDYFFIGNKLIFVSIVDATGNRAFGAPPVGTDNVQLFTYIDAGDLINPQVSANITEEMIPLDPRESLVIIADTHNVTLNSGGNSYAEGDVLTVTGGTFTTPMTLLVTDVSAGVIQSNGIVIIDSGEYTVLPGAASATTVAPSGGTGATIDFVQPSYSFKIHKDTTNNVVFTRNSDASSTTLTSLIDSDADTIPVSDETLLYTTAPSRQDPQVAWIGTERIVYHGISANNELTSVIRGTNGTSKQEHVSGTKIYDGGTDQDIPTAPYRYWVNSTNSNYANGSDAAWRFHGNEVYLSDGTDLTMHTSGSILVGDTAYLPGATGTDKHYYIKDLIVTGEISRIDISNAGTGYTVGDVISLTDLDAVTGLGPPSTSASLVVGEVDVNGGILYVSILNRGAGYTSGDINILLNDIGDGTASIDIYTDREGLVLAQPVPLVNQNGMIVEQDGLIWHINGKLAGGIVDGTTPAALFLDDEPGNALTIPQP